MIDLDEKRPRRMAVSNAMSPAPEFFLIFVFGELAFLAIVFLFVAWLRGFSLWWFAASVLIVLTPLGWLLYRRHIRNQHDWDRVTFLEFRDERIALVPSRKMRGLGYTTAEAPFPLGARLECHIETGDRYFSGDHGQFLQRSLWVVEPTGAKWRVRDFSVELNYRIVAANLQNAGIPFRIVKVYDGEKGEHMETDVTVERIQASTKAGKKGLVIGLIGTSGLWLGALAGALVHNGRYVIAIGVLGYAAIAIATIAIPTKIARRTALIQLVTLIPSYAGGYAVMAILVRHMFHR